MEALNLYNPRLKVKEKFRFLMSCEDKSLPNTGFALEVIGCHVGVDVVPMMIIYQEKILFTYQVISGLGNPHKLCRPSLLVLLSM